MVENKKTVWAIILFVAGNAVAIGGLYLSLTFAFLIISELLHTFVVTDYNLSELGKEFHSIYQLASLPGLLSFYIPITALLLVISESLVYWQNRFRRILPVVFAACLLGMLALNVILSITDLYRMPDRFVEPYLLARILSLAVYALGGSFVLLFCLFRRRVYAYIAVALPLLFSIPLVEFVWRFAATETHGDWIFQVDYPFPGRITSYLGVMIAVYLFLAILSWFSRIEKNPGGYAFAYGGVMSYVLFLCICLSILFPFHYSLYRWTDKVQHSCAPIVGDVFYILWAVIIVVQAVRFFRRRRHSRPQERIAESC